MAMNCDYCSNYIYDEEEDSYYCDVNLDEDEYYRLVHSDYKNCPYYHSNDDYKRKDLSFEILLKRRQIRQ